ncbi:hypothetical protein ACVIGB_007768 [Bradyrhizobium sp. USDA 4341]
MCDVPGRSSRDVCRENAAHDRSFVFDDFKFTGLAGNCPISIGASPGVSTVPYHSGHAATHLLRSVFALHLSNEAANSNQDRVRRAVVNGLDYPDGDKSSNFNTYGYGAAQLLAHVLRQCGDDLTRDNVMKQAASLKDVVGDLALPGVKINTSPTDYRLHKRLRMMRFDGERWELFGPILEVAGPAG